ncbi:MAG: exostosin family protein [Candidatus Hermodarchaeota archaeon]
MISKEILVKETNEFRPLAHTYQGFGGPWLEQVFYQEWIKFDKPLKRIYLPIFVTECWMNKVPSEKIQRWLNSLPKDLEYFTIIQHDDGVKAIQVELPPKTLIFGSSVGDIVVPLIMDDTLTNIHKKKKKLISFCGTLSTHPIRKEINELMLKEMPKDYIYYFGSRWQRIMSRSVFSLCPRGYGPTSYRLYESIFLESIPIYIWKDSCRVPYTDFLDWSKFSFILNAKEINTIPSLVRDLSAEKIKSMQEELKRVRIFFTKKWCSQWILKKMS